MGCQDQLTVGVTSYNPLQPHQWFCFPPFCKNQKIFLSRPDLREKEKYLSSLHLTELPSLKRSFVKRPPLVIFNLRSTRDLAVAAVAGLHQNYKILKQIPSTFLNINA